MRQLNPRELNDLLTTLPPDEQPLLLDVREPWEFAICHIEGARLLPMRQIPSALDQFDKHVPVVVICHHGIRSEHVALYLEYRGFTAVHNLRGGVDGWARDVDPQMATY